MHSIELHFVLSEVTYFKFEKKNVENTYFSSRHPPIRILKAPELRIIRYSPLRGLYGLRPLLYGPKYFSLDQNLLSIFSCCCAL